MHVNYALSQHYSTHAKPKQIAWPFRVLSGLQFIISSAFVSRGWINSAPNLVPFLSQDNIIDTTRTVSSTYRVHFLGHYVPA